MTEQQILFFLTLVEEKSFSKAAKKLYITQPSFSQYIMKIESQVGAKLIDRSSTPIKLTAAGEAFYEAALQTKAINDNLLNRIADLENLQRGSLRIGTSPFRGATLLSKSVYQFHKEFPGIDITIFEGSTEELAAGIQYGEIDIGIASGEFDEQTFRVEPLAEEKLYMAVAAANPLNAELGEFRIMADDILYQSLRLLKAPDCRVELFRRQSFIVFEQGENITRLTTKLLAEANMQPTVSLRTRNLHTVLSFVLADMGVALIPDSFIKYGNLHEHPYYYSLNSPHVHNEISLVSRRNRYPTKATVMYSQILKQLISSGTWRVS